MDHVTKAKRSEIMSKVRGRDTKPEMRVRRRLHALGYRYRLQAKELPGRPDIVFRPRRKAIFVHGCFWHRHEGCRYASTPKTRTEFWEEKFRQNIERDDRNEKALSKLGWKTLIIWECQLKNADFPLDDVLIQFLEDV